MTGFVYRVAYDIPDEDLTTVHVLRQALLVFPNDAAASGIKLTGEATARIDGGRVVCEASAEPMPGRRVSAADRYGLRIEELAAAGLPDSRIADVIGDGLKTGTVEYVRATRGIPSGRSQRRAAKDAA